MTTALVVPTLQDPTMGNHSPGGLFGASCERRANQPFEFSPIELIGTAETMHHMGFSSLFVRVPDALGEGVIGDA
jgi:hypothetical protein